MKLATSLLSTAVALAFTAFTSAVTANEVLFDNFGPGDTYSLDSGALLGYGGPTFGETHEAATSFIVSGGDFYLNTAEFAILHNWGPDLVYADILADDGDTPGSILDSTSASGVTSPFVWAEPMTATFSGTIVLEEGKKYWLALRSEQEDASLGWASSLSDWGERAWRVDGGPWNTYTSSGPPLDDQRSAFRITGTIVPAPGALALLGLAGLSATRRRRA